ncbi:MAG: TonB-dependent receptor [Bacteroidia bacterium]
MFISDPETVLDQELGLRFATRFLTVNANLYLMDFNNEIVLNGQFGPNGLALNSKVDRSTRSGLEVTAFYRFLGAFYLKNNSSFSRNRIRENGVEFQPILSPQLIVNQNVGWESRQRNLLLELTLRYQSRSYIDFANEQALPAYGLVKRDDAKYRFQRI